MSRLTPLASAPSPAAGLPSWWADPYVWAGVVLLLVAAVLAWSALRRPRAPGARLERAAVPRPQGPVPAAAEGGTAPAPSASEAPELDDPLAAAPARWLELAEEAARTDDHPMAIGRVYMGLLVALARAGVLDLKPGDTPREHLDAFRGSGLARETFEDVTAHVEAVFLHDEAADAHRYALVREAAELVAHRSGAALGA